MDRNEPSAWGGDDEDHPFVSSVGGESSVIDEDSSSSSNLELCEKPKSEEEKVVITGKPMQLEENDESSGKNKMKSKSGGSVSFALLDSEDEKEEAEDDTSVELGDESMLGREVSDDKNNSATKSEEVGETSKSKKKKKKKKKATTKSGRNGHEEDDFDKILAELGITPVSSAPIVGKIQAQPEPAGEKDGEEETVESAAGKKKKKKKDKDKIADTSSVEAKEDIQEKSSISEPPSQPKKKDAEVPKHVRKIQEIIARRKDAEEKKMKEEEEKLRKEEGERLAEEAREREAEEIKQRKKLKNKEKLQKMKQEGGFLTKRPVYANKRKPAHRAKANDSASVQVKDDVETKEDDDAHEPATFHERIDRIESTDMEEKQAAADGTLKNDDEQDDWEAKSGDSVDSNIMCDYDDEVEKEFKDTASKAEVAGIPTTSAKNAMPKDASKRGKGSVVNEEREENLRSPICCIMGHVDTGKTKLLDCIRRTNVQEGEAGGITQQIGATYFPAENIRERTKELKADAKLKVPGLLVIDTPGHESFANLRSRGSNLCDIAILVVDIMHGLEPQTIESLNLLRRRNTEFIVALNKVDRLFGWKTSKNAPIRKAMERQSVDVVKEFKWRLTEVITQFKEQGLNTELYYKNREMGETFSIVPTSATSGEGIPDLLLLLIQWAQKTMVEKLTYVDNVQCTVLEVKVIEGHGTTIDVVLVNGVLHEGDQIVVCGSQGPIVTSIRSLLTPQPLKEIRVKGTYMHHREVKAAQCIKITAQGLEHAVAGTALHVIGPGEGVEEAKKTAMEDMKSVMSRIDKSGEGVYVQASTLGSLEALLEFLKSPDVQIPIRGIGIGPVHKKDIMKAGAMLERRIEYATVLAFDVKVTTEARELADKMGVKIFCADIIYHLFDQFKVYIKNIKEEKKKETASEVVFPCVLKILPNGLVKSKDPIILGVNVIDGILKVGTPICILKKIENLTEFMNIGRIASIQINKQPLDYAKKGQEVAIKIDSNHGEQKTFGRHFGSDDELISHISRRSMDILETSYRDEISEDEWKLVLKLQKLFKIL